MQSLARSINLRPIIELSFQLSDGIPPFVCWEDHNDSLGVISVPDHGGLMKPHTTS